MFWIANQPLRTAGVRPATFLQRKAEVSLVVIDAWEFGKSGG